MRLFLFRHTAPTGCEGICYGRLDVDIDYSRFPDAVAALRAQLPVPDEQTPVWSSPASRCRMLAMALAGRCPVNSSEDLREIDFGCWEGVAWDRIPRGELDAWARDPWNYRVGGGESARMLSARWSRWLDALRGRRTEQAVVVTHAGVIRAALACASSARRDELLQAEIAFGSIQVLDV